MFLTENSYAENYYGKQIDVPADYATFALQESENYHTLVESMIIAEHTAIMNEDMALLEEAKSSFFSSIADLFKRFGAWVAKVWKNFINWIKSIFDSNKKLAERWEKATEKRDVTLKKSFNVTSFSSAFQSDEANKIFTQGTANLTKLNNTMNNFNGTENFEEDGLLNSMGINYSKKDFKKLFTEKMFGKEVESVTYDVNSMKVIASYLKTANKTQQLGEAKVKKIINSYKLCEKSFKKIASIHKTNKEEDIASSASKYAAACRKIASVMNRALSVFITTDKKMISLSRAILSKSMSIKLKEEKEKDNDDDLSNLSFKESGNILDQFSIY